MYIKDKRLYVGYKWSSLSKETNAVFCFPPPHKKHHHHHHHHVGVAGKCYSRQRIRVRVNLLEMITVQSRERESIIAVENSY